MSIRGCITIYPIHPLFGCEFKVEQEPIPFKQRFKTRYGAIHASDSAFLSALLEASIQSNKSWVNFPSEKGAVGIYADPARFKRMFAAITVPELHDENPPETYIAGVDVHLFNRIR